jgi:transcriptional regulator with XRE-family HTH domain
MTMKERILKFLQSENKSYAQFAEEIGVQPSGISHILSGRNNPSLDFILKMLGKYPALSSEWLLFGRGSMYKTIIQPTLFDDEPSRELNTSTPGPDFNQISGSEEPYSADLEKDSMKEIQEIRLPEQIKENKVLERVLFIYNDKTFSEYKPS